MCFPLSWLSFWWKYFLSNRNSTSVLCSKIFDRLVITISIFVAEGHHQFVSLLAVTGKSFRIPGLSQSCSQYLSSLKPQRERGKKAWVRLGLTLQLHCVLSIIEQRNKKAGQIHIYFVSPKRVEIIMLKCDVVTFERLDSKDFRSDYGIPGQLEASLSIILAITVSYITRWQAMR